MNTDYRNLTAINDFRDPQEYIFNGDLVEFTEFGVKLKDLIPKNVVLAATFTKKTVLNYTRSKAMTNAYVNGNVTIADEKLNLIGGRFPKQWVLPLNEPFKFAEVLPKSDIHFTYYPNYSGAPAKTQFIYSLGFAETESEKKNYIEILHTSSGDIVFNLYDAQGNIKTFRDDSFIIKLAQEPVHFTLSYNGLRLDGQDHRVYFKFFVNGEMIGNIDLPMESFDLDGIHGMTFGTMNQCYAPNFRIKNLVVTNEPILLDVDQFAINHGAIYEVPETRYSRDPQKVEPLFVCTMENLKSITVLGNSANKESKEFYVGYTFSVNGNEYFFDRQDLQWKPHLFPEDVSDLGYMLAYKDSLINAGCDFKCIPYLVSLKGDFTPSIQQQTIVYDQFVKYQEYVPTCLVYGYVRDVLGNFLRNAKVIITPSRSTVAEAGNFILGKVTKAIRTGANGYWDAQLPLSTIFNPDLAYNIQIIYREEVIFEQANIRITKEGTIKLDDLLAGKDPSAPEEQPSQPIIYPDKYIHGMVWQEIGDVEPDQPGEREDYEDLIIPSEFEFEDIEGNN